MSLSHSTSSSEKRDILLLGATGYTGRLILKHIASTPSNSHLKVSVGGRSIERIQKVVKEVSAGLSDVEVLQVDVMNDVQVRDVIRHFHVVISAVGPFWDYGRVLVRACAELGVHYADTTGESHFIRNCIETCDYVATKTGAVIINAAGFDSVPSDMSAYLGVHALKRLGGPDLQAGKSVTAFKIKAFGFSGGTVATGMNMISGAIPKWAMARADGSYSLSPMQGPKVSDLGMTYKLPYTSIRGGMWFMGPPNAKYVRRTWGLFALHAASSSSYGDQHTIPTGQEPYGDEFEYKEFHQTKTWLGGFALSLSLLVGLGLLFLSPVRYLVQKFMLHQPGGGTQQDLEGGWMKLTNVTCSAPREGQPTQAVKTVIKGRGEPGYLLAAVMTAETALALLPSSASRLTEIGKKGGVLTAMSALGLELIERLKATGRFDFESELIEVEEEDRKTR